MEWLAAILSHAFTGEWGLSRLVCLYMVAAPVIIAGTAFALRVAVRKPYR